MKTAIFYKSFLGKTKKYALKMEEALACDIFLFNDFNKDKISEYETIIVSSGTYAGHMPLVSFLEKNWPEIGGKNVVVVAVGAIPAMNEASQKSFEKIPEDIRQKIKYFKLPIDMDEKMFGDIIDYIKSL